MLRMAGYTYKPLQEKKFLLSTRIKEVLSETPTPHRGYRPVDVPRSSQENRRVFSVEKSRRKKLEHIKAVTVFLLVMKNKA